MVDLGSVIHARVNRIEPYGLYFRYGDENVIVLAPEVSWTATGELSCRVSVGDEFDVVILRRNYQTGELVGSIRRLQKDQNPYLALSRLARGEKLEGTVTFAGSGNDVIIRLPNGAFGELEKKTVESDLRNGETIQVQIESLDSDEGRLRLAPARGIAPSTHHPIPASTPAVPLETSK